MGRNLTPSPSPIALPPSGRGERGWSGDASRLLYHIGNDVETHSINAIAQAKSPSPGRWEGDGRGDRGEVPGGGHGGESPGGWWVMGMVRFRAGEARLLLAPHPSAG